MSCNAQRVSLVYEIPGICIETSSPHSDPPVDGGPSQSVLISDDEELGKPAKASPGEPRLGKRQAEDVGKEDSKKSREGPSDQGRSIFPFQKENLPCQSKNGCALTCSACKWKVCQLFAHPFFDIGVCIRCLDQKLDPRHIMRWKSTEFRADFCWKPLEDGQEKYCRCCGDGGDLHLCDGPPGNLDGKIDLCPRTLCSQCVVMWHPRDETHPDKVSKWLCPACESGDKLAGRGA
eukprot:2063754-Rhodomonas_salina.1